MKQSKNQLDQAAKNPKEECRFCKTKLVIRYGKTAYICDPPYEKGAYCKTFFSRFCLKYV